MQTITGRNPLSLMEEYKDKKSDLLMYVGAVCQNMPISSTLHGIIEFLLDRCEQTEKRYDSLFSSRRLLEHKINILERRVEELEGRIEEL